MLAAILIGFGFSNSFLCVFVAFDITAGRNNKVCLSFVGGRFAGIMALGAFVTLFGWYVDLDGRLLLLVFAIMSVLFGALILFRPRVLTRIKLLRSCQLGGCGGCEEEKEETTGLHDCSSCPSAENCGQTSKEEQKPDHQELSTYQVTFLGFVRGATPCLKVLLLVPLLLTLPFLEALVLTALFALASSIYPIIGILAGDIIGTLVPEKRTPQLTRAAAVVLMVIGVYFLYRFWSYTCSGGI